MKKTGKIKIAAAERYVASMTKTAESLCSNCKEIIIFTGGQDSKLCPGCGNLVQNVNR